MDQIKIGKFIASLRKEFGYTQEQLAEKLNVSNKTISRWENGNTMPDLSIIPQLCEILGISINELLSGERIDDSEYQKKLEENIIINMNLLKTKIKKISKILFLTIVIGINAIIIGLFVFIGYKESTYRKIFLSDSNIEIKACKHKEKIGIIISTKDKTSFLYDSYYDEETKTYVIENLYKYIDENNMKNIASSATILFDKDISQITYKDKTIYKIGDILENCD